MKRALPLALLASFAVPWTAAATTDDPVARKGRWVTQYRDEKVKVVVGYRHASNHMAAPWIFLDTWISAEGTDPIRIGREDVWLEGPGGLRLNLPSQRKMAEGIPDYRRLMYEASVSRDPIEGYFPAVTNVERLAFFAPPTQQLVFDEVSVNQRMVAAGDLFFESPTGMFAPGKYTLVIANKWVDVRLPFELPAPALEKDAKKDSKTVPW